MAENMYLLWEWTDEREAKMHVGIFSTLDKAKQAGQRDWEKTQKGRGAEDHELGFLRWEEHGEWISGHKPSSEDEDLYDLTDSECPYEISVFELDTLTHFDYMENSTEKIVL